MTRAHLFAAAAALGLTATVGHAGGGDLAGVRAVLEKPYASDSRSQDEVIDELASLGQGALPAMFRLYCGEGWEEFFGDEEEIDVDELWCPPDRIHDLLLPALGRMPARHVVEHLRTAAAAEAPHETRLAAVRVLGELGSVEALEPLLRLGEDFGPLGLRYRSVQKPMEEALTAVFDGDPTRSARELAGRVGEASDGVLSLVVTALGRAARPELLTVFGTLVRGEGEVGLHALEVLADFVGRAPWRFDDAPADLARGFLVHEDWRYRRAAAFTLAQIGDAESFPRLILLLDDGSQPVASAAAWALRTLSGVEHPESSTAWLDWYSEQTIWWHEHEDELYDGLHSRDPRSVGEALRAFYEHPLFRDAAARELVKLLDSSDETVVLTALSGLRDLRSQRVVPELVWLVESRNDRVRAAALETLGRLTGAELPPSRDAWRSYVEG